MACTLTRDDVAHIVIGVIVAAEHHPVTEETPLRELDADSPTKKLYYARVRKIVEAAGCSMDGVTPDDFVDDQSTVGELIDKIWSAIQSNRAHDALDGHLALLESHAALLESHAAMLNKHVAEMRGRAPRRRR